MTPKEKADNFLAIAQQFKLGDLPTETPHPKTAEMSQLANNDLPKAIQILKSLDLDLLDTLKTKLPQLEQLQNDIHATLQKGGRIFLCGCGATGRLSLSLEVFWREQADSERQDRVIAFMAGGDSALIKSIERFEDHPDWAERQLKELGFRDGDLLISSTEGGETPFVIGATEAAVAISAMAPYFLYCNPDDILVAQVERSRKVIQNPKIKKIVLFTGPMALSGSTRMQASTILMFAIGLPLYAQLKKTDLAAQITKLKTYVEKLDFSFLAEFIEAESATYKAQEYIVYETNRYGITVMTDTTERSPTFSLLAFENTYDPQAKPALCYLSLPEAPDSRQAWHKLLHRDPRPLNWGDRAVSTDYLYGFDISANAWNLRCQKVNGAPLHKFRVWKMGNRISFEFRGHDHEINVRGLPLLCEHLVLKMLMNIHSTLIMGRLVRYQNNIMIWVKPSNNKLIDRAIRYVRHLLKGQGITDLSYEDTAYALYEEIETLQEGEPIVLKTCDRILRGRR